MEFQLHVYSNDVITKDLKRISRPISNAPAPPHPKIKPDIFIEKLELFQK